MKAVLRSGVRRLADLPLIGRWVRIVVAAIRMPEFRASYFERLRWQEGFEARLEARIAALEDRAQRLATFESEQLPTLLAKLSDMNDRQVRQQAGQENLARSLPVTLRRLARDLQDVREQSVRLGAPVLDRIGALDRRLDAVAAEAGRLAEPVSYLLGRVEFVRRELMFEMRYGASRPGSGAALAVEPKVLASEKLDAARRSGTVRLNLGCGHVPLEGYLNVDRRELPGVDIVADIDRLPLADGEALEIFSAHVLEHFPQEQLRRELLPYFLRLLAPGGSLRAVVPDAEAMLREYSAGHYPYEDLREVLYGGQDYDGDFHFNMFTPQSLSSLLEDAGFVDVEVPVRGRVNGRCYEFEIHASKRAS